MPASVGSRPSGQRIAEAFRKMERSQHHQHIRALLVSGVCLVSAVIGLSLSAAAQSDTTTAELDTYRTAISASTMSERDSGLNALIARYPASTLRNDALAILAWDHYRTGRRDDAVRDATALRNRDASNPLAMAILLALSPPDARDGEHAQEQQLSRARAALDALRQLRRPTGMADTEFRALSQQVTAIVAGFVGHEELASKQYTAAREHLRMAAAAAPDHPPYSYELALADLSGHKPNESEAFWYLARAVVLSHGTAGGQEVAEFAVAKYREAGGTNADWQKFLTAAAGSSGGPQITLASAKPAATPPAVVPAERALKASANQQPA